MPERFIWNQDKNRKLMVLRGVDFPMVLRALEEGKLLADVQHTGEGREHQRILIVSLRDDVYAVPYVTDGRTKFLKTIFPSRKYRQIYGVQGGQS